MRTQNDQLKFIWAHNKQVNPLLGIKFYDVCSLRMMDDDNLIYILLLHICAVMIPYFIIRHW